MAKKMLIDASHSEELRVAVVDGNKLVDFDSEISTKKQLKGSVYLAKVVRIEPSLQAAFIDYGGGRHGFLPFGEIHPDYYRIPIADRDGPADASLASGTAPASSLSEEDGDRSLDPIMDLYEDGDLPRRPRYNYKIQEVIKRRQILLVQVVKEERGNKGVSLTTFLSLPGRYCVLMPNAGHRGGGISRKILDGQDRQRLRDVLKDLEIAEGMSLIVRTAGQEKNKMEIRRDYEYLMRLWEDIRQKTLKSIAPELIYAEGDLIKRSIRDTYSKEIDSILIEGDEAYKSAKGFMKTLLPSHAKRVQHYKDTSIPLFHKFKVEEQVDNMLNPTVSLPSGGSIVINPTEALVAVDVNSGKSTKERHITDTAVKTNLEAADEVARQMRLRDLGGLIVVDFIDMNDPKHIQAVEKRLRDAVRHDRARIQLGRISQFGLMELSRQRLRPSILETNTSPCTHCHGTGHVRSLESVGLHILRAIESEGIQGTSEAITVYVSPGVDLYLLNQKRAAITRIELRYELSVSIFRDPTLVPPRYKIDVTTTRARRFIESLENGIEDIVEDETDDFVDDMSEEMLQDMIKDISKELSEESPQKHTPFRDTRNNFRNSSRDHSRDHRSDYGTEPKIERAAPYLPQAPRIQQEPDESKEIVAATAAPLTSSAAIVSSLEGNPDTVSHVGGASGVGGGSQDYQSGQGLQNNTHRRHRRHPFNRHRDRRGERAVTLEERVLDDAFPQNKTVHTTHGGGSYRQQQPYAPTYSKPLQNDDSDDFENAIQLEMSQQLKKQNPQPYPQQPRQPLPAREEAPFISAILDKEMIQDSAADFSDFNFNDVIRPAFVLPRNPQEQRGWWKRIKDISLS